MEALPTSTVPLVVLYLDMPLLVNPCPSLVVDASVGGNTIGKSRKCFDAKRLQRQKCVQNWVRSYIEGECTYVKLLIN